MIRSSRRNNGSGSTRHLSREETKSVPPIAGSSARASRPRESGPRRRGCVVKSSTAARLRYSVQTNNRPSIRCVQQPSLNNRAAYKTASASAHTDVLRAIGLNRSSANNENQRKSGRIKAAPIAAIADELTFSDDVSIKQGADGGRGGTMRLSSRMGQTKVAAGPTRCLMDRGSATESDGAWLRYASPNPTNCKCSTPERPGVYLRGLPGAFADSFVPGSAPFSADGQAAGCLYGRDHAAARDAQNRSNELSQSSQEPV